MRGTCERGAPEPAAERRGLLPMHRSARGPLPLLPTTHAAARALPPHAHPNRLPCRPARVLPCPCLAARAAQHGRRDTLSKRGMEAARCSPLLAGVLLLAGLGEAGPMRLLALVVSRVVCAGWGRAGQSATGQTPQSGAAVESLEMPCAARGAGRARAGHRLRASRPLEGLDCAQRPAARRRRVRAMSPACERPARRDVAPNGAATPPSGAASPRGSFAGALTLGFGHFGGSARRRRCCVIPAGALVGPWTREEGSESPCAPQTGSSTAAAPGDEGTSRAEPECKHGGPSGAQSTALHIICST